MHSITFIFAIVQNFYRFTWRLLHRNTCSAMTLRSCSSQWQSNCHFLKSAVMRFCWIWYFRTRPLPNLGRAKCMQRETPLFKKKRGRHACFLLVSQIIALEWSSKPWPDLSAKAGRARSLCTPFLEKHTGVGENWQGVWWIQIIINIWYCYKYNKFNMYNIKLLWKFTLSTKDKNHLNIKILKTICRDLLCKDFFTEFILQRLFYSAVFSQ